MSRNNNESVDEALLGSFDVPLGLSCSLKLLTVEDSLEQDRSTWDIAASRDLPSIHSSAIDEQFDSSIDNIHAAHNGMSANSHAAHSGVSEAINTTKYENNEGGVSGKAQDVHVGDCDTTSTSSVPKKNVVSIPSTSRDLSRRTQNLRPHKRDHSTDTRATASKKCRDHISRSFNPSDGGFSANYGDDREALGHQNTSKNPVDCTTAKHPCTATTSTKGATPKSKHADAAGLDLSTCQDTTVAAKKYCNATTNLPHQNTSRRRGTVQPCNEQKNGSPTKPRTKKKNLPKFIEQLECGKCNQKTLHRVETFSLHCRAVEDVRNTYTSKTCTQCELETSLCPNHTLKDFCHPHSIRPLVWKRVKSKLTSELVWELGCQVCTNERKQRDNQKKKKKHNSSRKLAKLTTKWTRCNHCKALYKKCKGVKGVHSSDKCKLNPGATNAGTPTPRGDEIQQIIANIQHLLDTNAFARLPKQLRDKVREACV